MRIRKNLLLLSLLLAGPSAQAEPVTSSEAWGQQQQPQQQPQQQQQHRLPGDPDLGKPPPTRSLSPSPTPAPGGVSRGLFASLERTARLVDIAYCVGAAGTGISPPFSCVSRCRDFPTLHLVRTWNTGVLLTDSCGYVAVDHGRRARALSGGDGGIGGGDGHGPGEEGADEDGDWAAQGAGGGPVREIVVAFRGTYSITNTIVDLSTVPQEYVPYPAPGDGDGDGDGDNSDDDGGICNNCTVHMGFMASWRNAREVVVPVLQAARDRHPGYRVHLVGHSLGGAVAALAALELKVGLGWDDLVVTTFGEPRVGNGALARYIDRAFGLLNDTDDGQGLTYRRVTHVGDPVPLLPLTEWGYRSHAGEIYIGKPDLPPGPEDLRTCRGDNDPDCMAGAEAAGGVGWMLDLVRRQKVQGGAEASGLVSRGWVPARLKLWQLFFAHRDYFWRLGLCVPGGDPTDWGREKYNLTSSEHLDDESELGDL